MADLSDLPEKARRSVEELGSADIVVGIPTYNNADTIGDVVRAAQAGLESRFSSLRAVIVNCDGGSADGTSERAQEAATEQSRFLTVAYPLFPVHKLSAPYHGIPGKGSAFRTMFLLTRELGAKACAVLDPGLRDAAPDWIGLMLTPVVEGDFDFVAPVHRRHKFESTLTNGVVYPVVRSLFGKQIRQPIGEEFVFSKRLLEYYLRQDFLNNQVVLLDNEIRLSVEAICSEFRLCQVPLSARTHTARESMADLSATLSQVLGPLFIEAERKTQVWQKIRGSEEVPVVGGGLEVGAEPVAVNVRRMIDAFRQGFDALRDVWNLILPPATMLDLKRLSRQSEPEFRFRDDVFARCVYDFLLGYRLRTMDRNHLLRAMTPLYLGWVASFLAELQDAGPEEAENRLERLCLAYEEQKRYLISRWRWPDRFSP